MPSRLTLVLLASLAACASDQKQERGQWEARSGVNYVANGRETEDTGDGFSNVDGFTADWVGVRHDLAIRADAPRRSDCACLSVEVGKPADAKFEWRGTRPDVNAKNLALAISANGVDCPGGNADPGARRPSIAGVTRSSGDVIIDIEEIADDRPLATGAIILPPEPKGRIYVRPRTKKIPYARPDGGKLCRVY